MKKVTLLLSLLLTPFLVSAQTVKSPNGQIIVNFSLTGNGQPTYEMTYKGRAVVKPSHLGLELAKERPAPDPSLLLSFFRKKSPIALAPFRQDLLFLIVCETDRVLDRVEDYTRRFLILFESVRVKHVKTVHVLENQHFPDLLSILENVLIGKTVRIASAYLLAFKSAALVAAPVERRSHLALRPVHLLKTVGIR